MKKLLLIFISVLSIVGCKKDEASETQSVTGIFQDWRFVGKWDVDSVYTGGIWYTINATSDLGDSMLITYQRLIPYDWIGLDSIQFGTWETTAQDSFFVHYFTAPQVYYSYKFEFSNSNNNIKLRQPQTAFIDSSWIFYHRIN